MKRLGLVFLALLGVLSSVSLAADPVPVTPAASVILASPANDIPLARRFWDPMLHPGEDARLMAYDEDVSQVVRTSNHGAVYMQLLVRDANWLLDQGLRSTTVTAWVNGVETTSTLACTGGGGGPIDFSGFVLVGAPGEKVVKAKLGEREAETRFTFRPTPKIEWTNIVEDEALFQEADMSAGYVGQPWHGGPEIVDGTVTTVWIAQSEGLAFRDLQWQSDFVDPRSIDVTLNGSALKGMTPVAHIDGEIARGSIPAGLFKAGLNEMVVSGLDVYGNSLAARSRFYAFRGNRIPVGTSLKIRLGRMGSKRGPNYSLDLKGSAFASVNPTYYLESNRQHFATIQADRVGDGVITVLQDYWHKGSKPDANTKVAHVKVEVEKP